MKKHYLSPTMEKILIQFEDSIIMASNGENLKMSTYGNRGNADDDTDGFWE